MDEEMEISTSEIKVPEGDFMHCEESTDSSCSKGTNVTVGSFDSSEGLSSTYIDEDSIIRESIIREEQRIAKENEKINEAELKKKQKELEKQLLKEALAKEEEVLAKQREAEIKERRFKRLTHLLKNSRMYSNLLREKLLSSTPKKKVTKKGKSKGSQEAQAGSSGTSAASTSRKRKAQDNSFDLTEVLDSQELTDGPETESESAHVNLTVINYFGKTRVTKMGFTVSDYQPKLFEGGMMRDYQLQGLEWLKVLFSNGINGILGDEMGLGKTIQVIAFICSLYEQDIKGPFIVIAPLSTISNWILEFKRFAPKVPVILFHGNNDDRKSLLPQLTTKVNLMGKKVYPVTITSYQMPVFEKRALGSIQWHYMIIDEGHRIKNHNSQLTRTLRDYDTIGRLLLTGTPLQNNLYELWSLLNFLLPEVFNALDVFESWFDVQALESGGARFMEEESNVNVVTTLQEILVPFLLRREKKDVDLQLPPKKELLVYCPMSSLQKELYQATVDRTIERLLYPKKQWEALDLMIPKAKRQCTLKNQPLYVYADDPDKDPERIIYEDDYVEKLRTHAININMQNTDMQLRKIVNHPYLVQFPLIVGTKEPRIDEDLINLSGKLLVLDAMLAKLKAGGHRVLLFSTFYMMLDIFEEHLIMRGYKYCRLDGSTSLYDREATIENFNTDPDVFVFLISIRAGGLGLNLTGADTVILYDSDWNPQVNLQAQDRCHRIGQTKPVFVYRFCTSGTVDERIIERGSAKRRLEKMIIKKGLFSGGIKGSKERPTYNINDLQDLKKLLESTDHDVVIHSNGYVFSDEELDALLDRSKAYEAETEPDVQPVAVRNEQQEL